MLLKLAEILDQLHFIVREERHDRSFGNGLLVLEGDGFRIRVSQDRDETHIEVGQIDSQAWYAVGNVLEFLTGHVVPCAEVALPAHFGAVSELMKSDLEERGYLAFERQKAELATQRLFPT